METKIRIEIICSQSLEEDFTEEFKKAGVDKFYTKFNPVMGSGYNNPHLGDSVWPQLNMMYLIYTDKENSEKIIEIVKKLRKLYVTEGIGCFVSEGNEI